jgi:thiamine transport system substrate-binding protein
MRRLHPTSWSSPLWRSLALALLAAGLAGASATPATAAEDDVTITLVTHDSFAVSKKVLREFTARTGVNVEILRAGDAGTALNQVILTKDAPLGDLFFGVDNTFLTRALDAEIFQQYGSSELADVGEEYELDAEHRVNPIDHGDVCINYDKRWFDDHDIAVPTSLADLTKKRYKGLLVTENPSTSSPGLAFLLATRAKFGEDGWERFWQRLRANEVQVVAGWEEAYNGSFTAGEGSGDRPLVVSYASSPPAAVYYSDPRPATSPVGTMLSSCFRQVEGVGILKGTEHPEEARELVDFMLSAEFQADLPLQMFVFPVRNNTPLPPVFEKFADVPEHPLELPPSLIGANRERWIDEWTDTVLR